MSRQRPYRVEVGETWGIFGVHFAIQHQRFTLAYDPEGSLDEREKCFRWMAENLSNALERLWQAGYEEGQQHGKAV
jgi:hypothetical protein